MSLLLGPVYPQGAPPAGVVSFGGDEVDGYLTAYWTISYDGSIYQQTAANQRAVATGVWIDPQVGMNLYECRATQLDTSPPNGTYNTWLDLGTTASSWGFSATAQRPIPINTVFPDKTGTFFLEIRRKSDQVVVASGNVIVAMGGNA